MKYRLTIFSVVFFLVFSGCTKNTTNTESIIEQKNKGKLFIIGGGKRPDSLMKELIKLSGLNNGGFGVVLPMASEEPDSAFYYTCRQFADLGITELYNFNFEADTSINPAWIDSLLKAKLIYISGGDQNKFMSIVLNTEIHVAVKQAYKNGATIAGTSAGAAVMSKIMISGNEKKYPIYTGNYQTIEANNIELAEGLGLLENCIIDQHFIRRMRMNRLITVALENPNLFCIGIDESTALVATTDSCYVLGESQIVVLLNNKKATINEKELLGGNDLLLDIYVPLGRIDKNLY